MAREHIESIRRDRFFIGREEKNPLAQIVHRTVNYLSEELYSKDVHFLMELIQNAEDNEYPAGVAPSLEFIITSKDLTTTGAPSTMMVCNNERGFSSANVDSICGAGISTKKGNRHQGYIGEKGIGFKSVFLISRMPHIFSNGYQIRFNEDPCHECSIGYIVPEWVDENLTISERKQVYGPSKSLPTTTIILPLKPEKVLAVKNQLSKMHPEILLFLSKIKQLSVREDNDDPKLNTVSQISISSETDVQMRKNVNAESYTLHLAAHEDDEGEEEGCSYYMWKQTFPVISACRVEKRMEVDEWVITLAFPWEQRLNRGLSMPGVYAFLPTEMITNFPFIIQADFLLSSSRESILLDSPWNKGILECVPSAFVNAFVSLVKSDFASSSSISSMFRFLPTKTSSIPVLDSVRLGIKERIAAEYIIPVESQTAQKYFCKPSEVGRLNQAFWDVLAKAKKLGVNLKNLSSHGTYVLSSSFDTAEYNEVLDFLGVRFVEKEWYGKCIESSNLVREVTEEVYLDILCFVADNWVGCFQDTNMQDIPLIKCVGVNGVVSLWSISRAAKMRQRLCIASEEKCISWLISWNREFCSFSGLYFLPESTERALVGHSRRFSLLSWLKSYVNLQVVSVDAYGRKVLDALSDSKSKTCVIAFTHFLFHCCTKWYLDDSAVKNLCSLMPLVDNYGNINAHRNQVLVPAKGSMWVELMGSNPWRQENYVELGAEYMSAGSFAGNYTKENQLLTFLQSYVSACDIPLICPPNATFSTVSSPLTKKNTFLLLDWIKELKYRGIIIPPRFLDCIKNGSWLKTSVGYKPPSQSFLSSSDWGNMLQMGDVIVDIPMIDQAFYDRKMHGYVEELRLIGVMFEYGEALTFIGNNLLSMAANYTLSRGRVICLLKLIRFLREKNLSPKHLICRIKDGTWLKTSHGYRSPVGSIMFNCEWTTALSISNLPFIDKSFYGSEILNFEDELELLGVIVRFHQNHQLVLDYFKLSYPVTADAAFLILECIRNVKSSDGFVNKLRGERWIKTHLGYKTPCESFLVDSEWDCLLEVVDEVPLIDQQFYGGRIGIYKEEMKKCGVLVQVEDASKSIAHRFKLLLSSSSLTKKNVVALLLFCRLLKGKEHRFPADITNCMRGEKWLHTRMGFKSPKDSILFDPEWADISSIAALPFIDDTDNYYGKEIYEYKEELKDLGVVVKFKGGAHFVLKGLNFPKDPSAVSPPSVFSLLGCIRIYKEKRVGDFPKEFTKSIDRRWVKTVMGFTSPARCILFNSKWETFLQRGDGPFIDEACYGSEITTYKEELKELGVIVELASGCSLIAEHLKCFTQTAAITRIYMYLSEFKWKPENVSSDWIWIPNKGEGGTWVRSNSCVLHDTDNLFSLQLHVLDKCYEHKLLGCFFSKILEVKNGPTLEDYCKLWNTLEASLQQPTGDECCAFWLFVAKHWSTKAEKLLKETITKLPVLTGNGVLLCDKQDVFIPDDLLLKDLFDESAEESLFIWYPPASSSSTSRAKMNSIYSSLGVRTISEAIEKNQFSISNYKRSDTNTVIKMGLIRIVLGFLSDPLLDICVEQRQQIVKYLLDNTVFETDEPITVSYSLQLSSGKKITVKSSRILRWEREDRNLFVQKIDRSSGLKAKIEYATYFSEVISQGLLFEKADQIAALAELIKIGCLLDFDAAAVGFLMKNKNLQVFVEDEEFLLSAFSSLNA